MTDRSSHHFALNELLVCFLMSPSVADRHSPSLERSWIVTCADVSSAAAIPLGRFEPLALMIAFDLPTSPPL